MVTVSTRRFTSGWAWVGGGGSGRAHATAAAAIPVTKRKCRPKSIDRQCSRNQGFCCSVVLTILTPILFSTQTPHFFGPLSRAVFCRACGALGNAEERLTLTGCVC